MSNTSQKVSRSKWEREWGVKRSQGQKVLRSEVVRSKEEDVGVRTSQNFQNHKTRSKFRKSGSKGRKTGSKGHKKKSESRGQNQSQKGVGTKCQSLCQSKCRRGKLSSERNAARNGGEISNKTNRTGTLSAAGQLLTNRQRNKWTVTTGRRSLV